MNQPDDKALFKKITEGDVKAFETIFHAYYSNLCRFASGIISDDEMAEEIVQDFFVKLWEKKAQLSIDISVKNYLYRAVKNRCINFIKHNNIKSSLQNIQIEKQTQIQPDEHFLALELAKKIEESIHSLPEKRREIFRLSREEGLKYNEIAKKLNISLKTVEAQMGLAIKALREKLKNHISFLILFLCFHKK
jgi:RNA polymerase sigma-70 factor, ECF subfamily